MIFDVVVSAILSVLQWLLSLFPLANQATISKISSGASGFRNGMASANWIFPVDTFFTFVAVIFSIEFILFSYRLYKWIAQNVSAGILK